MVGGVAWYIHAWPPIYSVEATLMAEPDYDYQRDSFYTGWDVFRKDESRTELELITSGPVLADVVRKENLKFDDVYHPFLSQVSYFWEKSYIGQNYRNLKKKFFPVDETDGPTPEEMEFGRTVGDLSASVEMAPVGESSVGKLKVKGPSRKVARIANTLLDVYLARRIERHRAEAKSSYDILNEQVRIASKEMKVLLDHRVEFSQQHMLTFDFQKEGLEVAKLAELEAGIANSRAKIAGEEASLREVESQLAMEPVTKTIATVSEVNALRESTKAKRLELQTTLISVRERYREDSPEVREIKNSLDKLDALASQLSETVEKGTTEGLNVVRQDLVSKRNSFLSDLEGTRAGLAVMEETAAKLQARLSTVPGLQNELQDMDRDLAAASEKYKQLLVKLGQATVSLSTAGGTIQSVRIVDYAANPGDKTWPKPKYLYPSAVLVGLILGMSVAVMKSYASGKILREHVEHGRGTVPLYGTILVSSGSRPMFVAPHAKTAAMAPIESPDKDRT
jgi:uncharacterized protein involved in exopolysaccharide biosynthesis